MSGKAYFVNGEHGPAIIEGPLTALNWLTILPVPSATAFDRVTGGRVMASVPFIGIVLGIVGGAIAFAATSLGVASIVAATVIVCFWELFTRFMHLDGLADVSDALGSYAPPARAREIIADPATGLIGMGACLISILIHISFFHCTSRCSPLVDGDDYPDDRTVLCHLRSSFTAQTHEPYWFWCNAHWHSENSHYYRVVMCAPCNMHRRSPRNGSR